MPKITEEVRLPDVDKETYVSAINDKTNYAHLDILSGIITMIHPSKYRMIQKSNSKQMVQRVKLLDLMMIFTKYL